MRQHLVIKRHNNGTEKTYHPISERFSKTIQGLSIKVVMKLFPSLFTNGRVDQGSVPGCVIPKT